MSGIQAALLGGFVVLAGLVLLMWAAPRKASLLEQRIGVEPAYPGFDHEDSHELELAKPFRERALLPLLDRFGKIVMARAPSQDIQALRLLQRSAGKPGNPETVFALQFVYLFAFGFIGLLLASVASFGPPLNFGMPLLAAMVGFMMPRTSLKRIVKKRRKAMAKVLPDMMDLLTVSVEAGLSFEGGLRKVCEKLPNELSDEFHKALDEYRLGIPLGQALKSMAERVGLPSLQNVIRTINQSETLGTSLSQILRIQAETLRRDRRARAQEMGNKAPVKMLIPMAGCIFPTIFIIILGPAVLRITGNSG